MFQSGYRSGKLCLLPFDKFYEKDGRDNMDKTTLVRGAAPQPVGSHSDICSGCMRYRSACFKSLSLPLQYVPNEYAIQMAIDFPNLFVPFGSVNPYRPDALEELDKCARCGVKVIKWLVRGWASIRTHSHVIAEECMHML